jgi:hypothetical protein
MWICESLQGETEFVHISAIPCYRTCRNTVPRMYIRPAEFSFQDTRHRQIAQAIILPKNGAPKSQ